MARKKSTQKQKQKQSQKVIVNVGGRGGGKKAVHHHHHHHSINQVLTDASSTHAVNNASNSLLGHISNMTKAFESRDAEREANAVRLSYGVNPTPAFMRGFNRPSAQTPVGSSGAEREAIARADAPNDNLIDSRIPVARGYRRIVNAEPAESSSDETEVSRRRYVVNSPRGKNITTDPNSPIPVQVAVSKRLIEDEQDLALNGLSLQNPADMTSTVPFRQTIPNTEEFIQTNPMMANTALRPNTGDGALTIIPAKTPKGFPKIQYKGEEHALSTFSRKSGLTLREIGDLNPEAYGYIQQYNAGTRAKHTQKIRDEKMARATVPALKRSQSDEDVKATDVSRVPASKVAEQIEKREHRAKSALQEHNDRMKARKQAGGGGSMSQMKQGGGFG